MRRKDAVDTSTLLEELGKAMINRRRTEVDRILTDHPSLINDLTPSCETPLIMAIRTWDPANVGICMKHGADPMQYHECSKDRLRPKMPALITFQEYEQRARHDSNIMGRDKSWEMHHKIYVEMLQLMKYKQ